MTKHKANPYTNRDGGPKTPKRAHFQRRVDRAERASERKAVRAEMSPLDQLLELDYRGVSAVKERARLMSQIGVK